MVYVKIDPALFPCNDKKNSEKGHLFHQGVRETQRGLKITEPLISDLSGGLTDCLGPRVSRNPPRKATPPKMTTPEDHLGGLGPILINSFREG